MTTKPRFCQECRAEFNPKRRWQLFCSARCREKAFKTRNPEINPNSPSGIETVAGWLRAMDWEHPLVVACRKAIECRKTQARKQKRLNQC